MVPTVNAESLNLASSLPVHSVMAMLLHVFPLDTGLVTAKIEMPSPEIPLIPHRKRMNVAHGEYFLCLLFYLCAGLLAWCLGLLTRPVSLCLAPCCLEKNYTPCSASST
jgi:hypothetical protein